MPSRQYMILGPQHEYVKQCNQHWGHSPKVNGALQLRALPCIMEYTENQCTVFDPTGYLPNTNTIAYLPNGIMWEGPDAASYSKFRGRLYEGSASLGVTFGSWTQSRDMIAKRSQPLAKQASELFERLLVSPRAQSALNKHAGRPLGELAALRELGGIHLEVIFGWQPLISDIHASVNTVVQTADKRTWVSGSAEGSQFDQGTSRYVGMDVNYRKESRLRSSRSAGIIITNPNAWLAERAGLSNPAAVAWDLVPWSFVVNMVSNVGSLVNSITDFMGLTFINASKTNTLNVNYEWRGSNFGKTKVIMISRGRFKYRSGSADQRPPLVWKVPDLNWETAAMAASLAVGRVSALSRFIH